MKKALGMIVCAALVLGLAACGVPQEKLDSLKAKHEEIKTKAGQLTDLMNEMESVSQQLGMGEVFPASVSTGLAEMEQGLAERDDTIANDLNKMNEKEVDEAIAVMDEELADLNNWLPPLEDINGSLANMVALMTSFEEQMNQIIEAASAGAFTTEAQDALMTLEEKATAMQEELNAVSAEMDALGDEDFQGVADGLAKAEGMLQELSDDAANILALMENPDATAA